MSKATKKISRKREQTIAKQTGGKRHTGSGSLWHKKSDASDSDFQYEDKYTENDKYVVKVAELRKIEKEALKLGKLPVFRFGFMTKGRSVDYAILREKDCVFNDEHYPILTGNKMMTLSAEELREYKSRSKKSIINILVFEGGMYVLMPWEDFLEVKQKILNGGRL